MTKAHTENIEVVKNRDYFSLKFDGIELQATISAVRQHLRPESGFPSITVTFEAENIDIHHSVTNSPNAH